MFVGEVPSVKKVELSSASFHNLEATVSSTVEAQSQALTWMSTLSTLLDPPDRAESDSTRVLDTVRVDRALHAVRSCVTSAAELAIGTRVHFIGPVP